MHKSHSYAAASGTTCGNSSVSSKATSVGMLSLLPKSMRKCPYCYRFGTSAHIDRCGRQEVSCIECGAVMQVSLLSAHVTYSCEKRDELTKCIGCGSLFLPVDVHEHLMLHCQGSCFPCSSCNQTFLTSAEYATHLYTMPSPCRRAVVTKNNEESPHSSKKFLKHHGRASRNTNSLERSKTEMLLIKTDGNPLYADVHQIQYGCCGETEENACSTNLKKLEQQKFFKKSQSEGSDVSFCPNRSKFLHNTAISSRNKHKLPVQMINVPAVNTFPTCGTYLSQNKPEKNNLLETHISTNTLHGGFLKRSLKVLKNLQERHDVCGKMRQRQNNLLKASAPRLATAELRERRIENAGKRKEEKKNEKENDGSFCEINFLRRSISTHLALRMSLKENKKEKEVNVPLRKDAGNTSVNCAMRRYMSCPARVCSLLSYRKQQEQKQQQQQQQENNVDVNKTGIWNGKCVRKKIYSKT